jgi:hypothetical protein
VFDVDVEHCPRCGGRLKIIAAIVDPQVIVKILTHVGLTAHAPPRSPARPSRYSKRPNAYPHRLSTTQPPLTARPTLV